MWEPGSYTLRAQVGALHLPSLSSLPAKAWGRDVCQEAEGLPWEEDGAERRARCSGSGSHAPTRTPGTVPVRSHPSPAATPSSGWTHGRAITAPGDKPRGPDTPLPSGLTRAPSSRRTPREGSTRPLIPRNGRGQGWGRSDTTLLGSAGVTSPAPAQSQTPELTNCSSTRPLSLPHLQGHWAPTYPGTRRSV